MFEIRGKHATATVMIDDVDQETVKQVTAMVNHQAAVHPVVIM